MILFNFWKLERREGCCFVLVVVKGKLLVFCEKYSSCKIYGNTAQDCATDTSSNFCIDTFHKT